MRSRNARVSGYFDQNDYYLDGKYWINGQVIQREDYIDYLNFLEKIKDRRGNERISDRR